MCVIYFFVHDTATTEIYTLFPTRRSSDLIIGAFLTIFGYLTIGPSVEGLVSILSAAVEWVTNQGLIPLLSIFMAPAQVLFLNNVVNHGILAPLGFVQAEQMGKYILFLVDT